MNSTLLTKIEAELRNLTDIELDQVESELKEGISIAKTRIEQSGRVGMTLTNELALILGRPEMVAHAKANDEKDRANMEAYIAKAKKLLGLIVAENDRRLYA